MENFNLKKFLTENKLTTASRLIKENYDGDDYDDYEEKFKAAEQQVKGAELLFSYNQDSWDIEDIDDLISRKNPTGKYYYWYDEPGEETGIIEITPKQALHAIEYGFDMKDDFPKGLPQGYEFEIYYKQEGGRPFGMKGDLDESKKALRESKRKIKTSKKKLNENTIKVVKADEDYAEFYYQGKLYKVDFTDGYEATENHGNFYSTGYVSGQDQFGNTWTMDADADDGRVVDVHPDTLDML